MRPLGYNPRGSQVASPGEVGEPKERKFIMANLKTAGATDAAPRWATAALVLADGAVFWGKGVGAARHAVGEVCFNTSMTGYQEIITDPSYAGQIISFTFPHIGNVGTNPEDIESINPAARGVVLRGDITEPSNWRAA